MIQTSFPSLAIIGGETREGKLFLKYADGTEVEAGKLETPARFEDRDAGTVYTYTLYAQNGIPHMELTQKEE